MTLSPFEPPARVSLKMLILKTVFLVLLASGRRRSELHSIRYDTLSRDESWSHIVLKTDPSFVSKTDLANKGQKTLEVIRIPALSEIVDNSLSEDLTLCPVSALRIYRQRTKSLRKDQKRLFLSFKKNYTKDIQKNTSSFWIRKAVRCAYESSSDETRTVHRIKAHDIRAMSASCALLRNVSLESIMGACGWRSHTTFTSHYLRDLTLIQQDLLKLGPLVVAQQRV